MSVLLSLSSLIILIILIMSSLKGTFPCSVIYSVASMGADISLYYQDKEKKDRKVGTYLFVSMCLAEALLFALCRLHAPPELCLWGPWNTLQEGWVSLHTIHDFYLNCVQVWWSTEGKFIDRGQWGLLVTACVHLNVRRTVSLNIVSFSLDIQQQEYQHWIMSLIKHQLLLPLNML